MIRTMIQTRSFISNTRNSKKPLNFLGEEGFLGMFGICLPIFRGKKIGTSVNTSTIYSSSLSPPPIRPMVENYPFFEIPALNNRIDNLIKECA